VKWFDRKFDFTFSAEKLPNLIVRLEGTPAPGRNAARRIAGDTIT
jgi:hypothetical protein